MKVKMRMRATVATRLTGSFVAELGFAEGPGAMLGPPGLVVGTK